MSTLLDDKGGDSLEERVEQTNNTGRRLLDVLKSIRYLEVPGFDHKPGDSYSILYICDLKHSADYETLKKDLLLVPNGLRVEVKNVDEEQPMPSETDPKKKEIVSQSKLIIVPLPEVTDPRKREEMIEKALRKMYGVAADYLEKRPNARKEEKVA